MSEWFKEHAWKVCVLQKGTAGSNPALSATNQRWHGIDSSLRSE